MAAKKPNRGLGTGLSALFTEPEDDLIEEEVKGKETETLPVSRVEPRADQPRKSFDRDALEELAESIRTYGLIQPITVRALDRGYYQIIAGERRWRAARLAGLEEVPVRVIEADERLASELALVENLQREDLNPLEEARGYRELMNRYGLTQEQVSQRVQKSRPAVANALRLLMLSEPVLAMVEAGELSAGHARTLLPLTDEAQQENAAKKIIAEKLSVRETEALVAKLQKGGPAPRKKDGDGVDYTREAETRLTNALGRTVHFRGSPKKGKIILEYYSADDREKLMAALLEMKKY